MSDDTDGDARIGYGIIIGTYLAYFVVFYAMVRNILL